MDQRESEWFFRDGLKKENQSDELSLVSSLHAVSSLSAEIDMVVEAPAPAELRLVSVFARIPPPTHHHPH